MKILVWFCFKKNRTSQENYIKGIINAIEKAHLKKKTKQYRPVSVLWNHFSITKILKYILKHFRKLDRLYTETTFHNSRRKGVKVSLELLGLKI